MALETLKDVKEIWGYDVVVMDDLKKLHPEMFNESGQMDYKIFESKIRSNYPIQIRHDKNSISFTIQNGPIKENGINGCQLEALIYTAKLMIIGLNEKFPCRQNSLAITKLDEALHWLLDRKLDREKRKVEGYSKA